MPFVPHPVKAESKNKAALEAHRAQLEGFVAGQPPGAGFFDMRLPRTPTGPEKRKLAVVLTCSAPNVDPKAFQEQLAEKANCRPATAVNLTPGGQQVSSVETPGGTQLPLMLRLGPFDVFAEGATPEPKRKARRFDVGPAAVASTAEALVTPPPGAKKEAVIHLTSDLLAAIHENAQQQKATGKKAHRDQNAVMHRAGKSKKLASMTGIAEALGIGDKDERFEWLHLVPHALLLDKAQKAELLVGGPAVLNTLQIPVENYLPILAEFFPGISRLRVSSKLIPGTHVAETIDYTIEITPANGLPPIILPFKFDAQLRKPPSRRIRTIVDCFMAQVAKGALSQLDALEALMDTLPGADFAELTACLLQDKIEADSLDVQRELFPKSGASGKAEEDAEDPENTINTTTPMPRPFFNAGKATDTPVAERTRSRAPVALGTT